MIVRYFPTIAAELAGKGKGIKEIEAVRITSMGWRPDGKVLFIIEDLEDQRFGIGADQIFEILAISGDSEAK